MTNKRNEVLIYNTFGRSSADMSDVQRTNSLWEGWSAIAIQDVIRGIEPVTARKFFENALDWSRDSAESQSQKNNVESYFASRGMKTSICRGCDHVSCHHKSFQALKPGAKEPQFREDDVVWSLTKSKQLQKKGFKYARCSYCTDYYLATGSKGKKNDPKRKRIEKPPVTRVLESQDTTVNSQSSALTSTQDLGGGPTNVHTAMEDGGSSTQAPPSVLGNVVPALPIHTGPSPQESVGLEQKAGVVVVPDTQIVPDVPPETSVDTDMADTTASQNEIDNNDRPLKKVRTGTTDDTQDEIPVEETWSKYRQSLLDLRVGGDLIEQIDSAVLKTGVIDPLLLEACVELYKREHERPFDIDSFDEDWAEESYANLTEEGLHALEELCMPVSKDAARLLFKEMSDLGANNEVQNIFLSLYTFTLECTAECSIFFITLGSLEKTRTLPKVETPGGDFIPSYSSPYCTKAMRCVSITIRQHGGATEERSVQPQHFVCRKCH
jgi:hypothetical protein